MIVLLFLQISWMIYSSNGIDLVDYIKKNGKILLKAKLQNYGEAYVHYVIPEYDYLLDTEERLLFSDVPLAILIEWPDPVLEAECPDLSKQYLEYTADEADYCAAYFPMYYEYRQVNDTYGYYYYYPRPEERSANSGLAFWTWKFPHLSKTEENSIQAEITKMDKLLYRVITTRVPQYQLTYTLNQGTLQNFLGKGYFYQPVLGHVIGGGQLPDHIAEKCPLLRKITIFKNDLLTFMGFNITTVFSDNPGNFTKKNSFYCAPYMGYCGAYLNLRRLPSGKRDADFMHSSDNVEVEKEFKNGFKFKIGFPEPQSLCWVWYPHRATVNSISANPKAAIRKANVRLIRGHWTSGDNKGFHVYSTNAAKFDNWVKNGKFKKGVDLGFVALEKTAPLTQCPSLIRMKIYQEQGGRQRTFIGGNNFPTVHTKGKWVLENKFYCAPYSGYCGATKYLWVYRSWKNDRDLEYITNATRAMELEKTDEYYTYQLCWIWQI